MYLKSRAVFIPFFYLFMLISSIGAAKAKDSMYSLSQDFLNAVRTNNVETVKQLLSKGVLVDTRDNLQRTALLLATWSNHVEVAGELIQAGADVNAKDWQQDSPFLVAGAEGKIEILKLTLQHGADIQSTNRYGGTALIPACEKGHPEAVRLLIAAGVDVNHINNLGWNCLFEVVLLGKSDNIIYQDIVKQLIMAKADLNLRDKKGKTAYEYAKQFKLSNIEKLLSDAGAQ